MDYVALLFGFAIGWYAGASFSSRQWILALQRAGFQLRSKPRENR